MQASDPITLELIKELGFHRMFFDESETYAYQRFNNHALEHIEISFHPTEGPRIEHLELRLTKNIKNVNDYMKALIEIGIAVGKRDKIEEFKRVMRI